MLPFEHARRLAPYLWTHQYTHLSPQTCFVIDDGAGRAVGYVIGCPNVDDFIGRYDLYRTEVLAAHADEVGPAPGSREPLPWLDPATGAVSAARLTQLAHEPEMLLSEGRDDMIGRYHAQMHIDLLEPVQGQGWGRKLIERFVESLRAEAAAQGRTVRDLVGEGVHVAISGENTKVVPFYEKVGFKGFPGGEREGCVWMVRDVE